MFAQTKMLSFSLLAALVHSSARLEPADGQRLLAVSLTNDLEPIGRDPWKPSEPFLDLDQRTGFNWSAFHLVQEIPEKLIPQFELLDKTKTDAALYLSVLPSSGWSAILDDDMVELVKRCTEFNMRGRSVFLRFAPGKRKLMRI